MYCFSCTCSALVSTSDDNMTSGEEMDVSPSNSGKHLYTPQCKYYNVHVHVHCVHTCILIRCTCIPRSLKLSYIHVHVHVYM